MHIPFCASKCGYCDFYSIPCPAASTSGRVRLIDDYCDALMLQMEDEGKRVSDCLVDSAYIGGGTPTMLSQRQLLDLLDCLCDNFKVPVDAEITLEANPGTVERFTRRELSALKAAGISRVSMGAQSSQDEELAALGRIHKFSDVRSSFGLLREAGFDNISLDLMYGIPQQTMESFFASLDDIISLRPEHISLYGLAVEPGTPFEAVRDQLILPSDDQMYEMYISAVDYLGSAGYPQYEISNFARPGRESRHNLRYWRGGEYLGFGAAAASFYGRRRTRIARDIDSYINIMRADGNLKPLYDEDEYDSDEDVRQEYIMLRLRLAEGISDSDYLARFGESFADRYQVDLLRLLRGGVYGAGKRFMAADSRGDVCVELYSVGPARLRRRVKCVINLLYNKFITADIW